MSITAVIPLRELSGEDRPLKDDTEPINPPF